MTPKDDFDNFDDDISTADDDASSAIDDGAGAAPQKKGSKLVLIIAVVFVLGIGGFIVASNLGLLGGNPPQSAEKAPRQKPRPDRSTASVPASDEAAPSTAETNAPDGMAAAVQALDLSTPPAVDSNAQAPAIDLSMPPAIGAPEAVPSIGINAPASEGIVAPVNPALQGDTPAIQMPAPVADNSAVPDISAPTPSIASPEAIAPAIAPVVSAMDAPQQPSIAPVVADTTVPAPVLPAPADQANAQVADIQKMLEELKATIATRQDIADINSRLNALEAAEVSRQEKQPVTYNNDSSADPAPAPKKAAPRKTRAAKPKAAPVITESKRWVLKAAKPGMAWVAEPGSSEIRAIATGDTVPGLGRIKAIVKDSTGKWTVEGTKSRVNQ